MTSTNLALNRLREGNQRFVAGKHDRNRKLTQFRRIEVAERQSPFAVILGCADSRVPAEIIFDQGLGDLFVVRVAGNIVAGTQISSVEFAVRNFRTPVVVVLGHSQCGAVLAALEDLRQKSAGTLPDNRCSIVDRIRPAIAGLLDTDLANDPKALTEQAVRANIHASVDKLRSGSATLERQVREGDLQIVGAEYSLETGQVEFLESV